MAKQKKPKRPPGRPRAPLPIRIIFRCTADEQARWTAAAEADGRTLSSWIRQVCNRASRRD